MPQIDDVVSYILNAMGSITSVKLQKLLYYSQAWSLVWDEAPLFPEEVEAWAQGPVVRAVYDKHPDFRMIGSWPCGDLDTLDVAQRETVDSVLEYYGGKSSQWLVALTKRERPWIDARSDLAYDALSAVVITHAAMAEYYVCI